MSKIKNNILKITLLIGFFSLLSRVLGILRSSLLSAFFGATESAGLNDCYTAAFRIPDAIYNLIVAGTLSIVLIPYFSGFLKKNEEENNFKEINKATSQFLNFFFIIMSFFIIIGFFATPFLVKTILAPLSLAIHSFAPSKA